MGTGNILCSVKGCRLLLSPIHATLFALLCEREIGAPGGVCGSRALALPLVKVERFCAWRCFGKVRVKRFLASLLRASLTLVICYFI
jgi:hypothetical protein